MERPSKNWRGAHRAALERARRTAIDPLEPIFTICAAVCILYVLGFLRLQFFDSTDAFTPIEATQILIVAFAGFLVPILIGSALTLHFASQKLQNLTEE
jgi:biotin transporter BioY